MAIQTETATRVASKPSQNRTVGIAEMAITRSTAELLVTYALGSCVGVTLFDPVAGVGGMIHCMLPLSKIDPKQAQENPAKFVDVGIPALFREAYRLGAQKHRIVVKVAGGSRIHDDNGHFKIGERNYMTLRKILWKNNVLIESEDVGGSLSRTMYLDVGTGQVTVKASGQLRNL